MIILSEGNSKAIDEEIQIDAKDFEYNKLSNILLAKGLEIIKAELVNSGKKGEIADKISKGKINKFISENTLLNQIWIMDPKKKVSDVLKENSFGKEINVLDFAKYKVGEGV